MRLKLSGVILLLILCFCSNYAYGWNCSRDGKSGQLHPHRDSPPFVDHVHWDIKAPGKLQHSTGCHLSENFLCRDFHKYPSASIVRNITREYENAYREGWNLRDIFANLAGVLVGIHSNDKCALLSSYDNENRNIDF